jgi:YD repeat-containing protein
VTLVYCFSIFEEKLSLVREEEMHRSLRWIPFVFTLVCVCDPLLAEIRMPQGDYVDKWVDLADGHMSFDRTYQSSSSYAGVLGFGWCSGFETRLVRDPATGAIRVKTCGRGDGGTFLPDERDSNRFVSADGGGQIVLQSSTYNFVPGSRLAEASQFDIRGRLIAVQRPGNPLVRIDRIGNAVSAILVGELRYQVSTDVNDRIVEIRSPDGVVMTSYFYDLDGNLVEVKNMWRNTYSYKYDAKHNLTFIGFPDGTHKNLTYESLGRVSFFSDRAVQGITCFENYEYGQKGSAYYWVNSEKKCPDGRILNKGFFDVRNSVDENGKVIGPVRRRNWDLVNGLTLSLMNPSTGQVVSQTREATAPEPTPEEK